MLDGFFVDLITGLAICAVLLGVVAWFVHYHDPEVIDEEEEAAVLRETPEEHQRAIAEGAARPDPSVPTDSDIEGFSE